MVLTRLAISNFFTHRIRVALTVAAIALSVSLVVAVTSGYASFEGAVDFYVAKYIGSTDAAITRQDHAPMAESIADEIAKDPNVGKVTVRLEDESGLLDSNGKPIEGGAAWLFGIRRPGDRKPEQL